MDDVLRFENVRKSFGAVRVLDGVDLTVAPGSVTVLIGPSGSGKSTLLRCATGLERIDSGRVVFLGEDLPTSQNGIRRVREQIGFVFQSFNLFPHLTALGNVTLAPRIVKRRSREEAERRAVELLNRVGLGDKADAYPDQLSGGQQQRVSIARALAMDPRLLLFDEPTSALDPELTQEVIGSMIELAQSGMTMLVVSHEMGFVRKAASKVAFIHRGRIAEIGAPEEIFDGARTTECRQFLRSVA